MSYKLEQLEHNMVKITMEIEAGAFDAAVNKVFNKNKNKIAVPGFRKGKAPRKMVEKVYGVGIFWEDALNEILPETYDAAVKELDVKVVSRPQIDVEKIEVGENVIVTATVAVKPEVTLGQYKNLEIAKDAVIVTEDDVEEEIKKTAERNSRMIDVEDRAAEMNDTVTIDYEGFVDGVAFDGGKGTDHALVLGSHSFIDTFEDQLVGKNVGDECDVNVTFPAEYHAADLAGKAATFKVAVKKIQAKELPEIDDEFAKDVSEFDTLDEYKADVRVKLTETKERQANEKYRSEVIEKVIENAEMDIPAAMIDEQADQMIQNFANSLRYQGMSMEQYLQMTGGNMVTLRNMVRPDAEKQIKQSLVLEAVAAAEGIEATDEEVEKEISDMAAMYRMEADKMKETMTEADFANIKEELKSRKAVDVLVNA